MKIWAILGLALGLCVVGCFGDEDDPEPEVRETIKASDFDQSCTINADCAAVAEGGLCAACSCNNAAINKEARAQFTAYAAGRTCEPPEGVVCGPCQETITVCVSGSCDVAPKVRLAASVYKTSCAVKEDCAAIFEGDGCAACKCENAAIHKDDLDEYNEARQAAVCGATGVACAADCASAEVDCVEGVCQLAAP